MEQLPGLKSLDFHENKLSVSIDPALMLLTIAQYIDMSCNMLWKMTVIPSFTRSLQYLNLSNNRLTGSLLSDDNIPLFDSLKVLDISSNPLSGQLPTFHFVYGLEVLRLSNNQFSGFIPFTLLARDSSVLIELDLSHNNISGNVLRIYFIALN